MKELFEDLAIQHNNFISMCRIQPEYNLGYLPGRAGALTNYTLPTSTYLEVKKI